MAVTLQDLVISDFPVNPGVQVASSATPTFGWTISGGVPTLYELQINYLLNSFASPTVYIQNFQSVNQQFRLPPEFSLTNEGIYYARIRGYDGSWGAWSATFEFQIYLVGPESPIISSVTSPASGFWQVISGIKPTNTYVYIRNNNGAWLEASYTNGLSGVIWSYNLPLEAGNNVVEAISSNVQSYSGVVSRIASATINLIVAEPEIYNIWNCFDEFGLLLGLPRIPGEKNKEYRARLLSVYQNPANSTYTGLKYGISRELGIGYGDVSINRLSDLMDSTYPNNILNSDGNAIGTPLERYAAEVYEHNPIFWGNLIADESYWDGVDQETNGYSYLPHIWDPSASGVYSKWQRGGIGDNNDLWVKEPIEVWNPDINDYSWYLQIHTGFFYSANPSGIR